MKTKALFLIVLLTLVASDVMGQGTIARKPKQSTSQQAKSKRDEIFTVVENDPEFPGGMEALYKYLSENIKYPQIAKENNITGRVFVTFVVEKDGSISNPRVLRDIGGGCGAEAVRVVKAMPRWKAGKQRGKAVRVQFNLPVTFDLNEKNR